MPVQTRQQAAAQQQQPLQAGNMSEPASNASTPEPGSLQTVSEDKATLINNVAKMSSTFSGKRNENFNTFFRAVKFNIALVGLKGDFSSELGCVMACLKDRAKDALLDIYETINNMDELEQRLRNRFGDKTTNSILLQQFLGIQQRGPLDKYIEVFTDQVAKAKIPEQLRESVQLWIIASFVKGLASDSVRTHVNSKDPKNISDAIKEARCAEGSTTAPKKPAQRKQHDKHRQRGSYDKRDYNRSKHFPTGDKSRDRDRFVRDKERPAYVKRQGNVAAAVDIAQDQPTPSPNDQRRA